MFIDVISGYKLLLQVFYDNWLSNNRKLNEIKKTKVQFGLPEVIKHVDVILCKLSFPSQAPDSKQIVK